MAASTRKQRLDRRAKNPLPNHSPKARIVLEAKPDSAPNSMTAEQARTLKDLARDGREPDAFQDNLSSEGAEVRIRVLRAKLAKDKADGNITD